MEAVVLLLASVALPKTRSVLEVVRSQTLTGVTIQITWMFSTSNLVLVFLLSIR
ncbi:hypothetical protein [Argonema galeatum]|uniref:hypothetical protein n=1 Tax=Argonema galeatum TaxID=2942762 RepID=UPI002011A299|nr:hypothetical protein [Argonema galeatum]MCL1468134.1 hypothetical protein [Argonema galeatum A003/A1]